MGACRTMQGVAGHLTFFVSLLLVGCNVVEGVVLPAPGDISQIRRPASPNTCLAGPAGFLPTPDFSTRYYDVSAEQLLATVQDVILAQPRTETLALDGALLRADYVVRSRVFGFPDIVLAQVLRTASGQSALVLYSYSLKGHYDFGVNRRRVVAILSALDKAVVQGR